MKNNEENKKTKICEYCGKTFVIGEGHGQWQRRYCSQECKWRNDTTRKDRHINFCAWCGKEIHRYDKPKGKMVFCDNKCQGAYKHAKNIEYRKCEFCGKYFECTKGSLKRFCNSECQRQWQKTRKGPELQGYDKNCPEEKRMVKCDYCGKIFRIRAPYKLESQKFHYCSKDCARFGIIKNQANNGYQTTPQKIVNEILEKLNYRYETEVNYGKYMWDNKICLNEDEYLFIEVMGTYWHTDPRFYEKPKNEIQNKNIHNDHNKKDFLIKEQKTCLYIWETDLLEHKEMCEKLIQEYCKNHGMLINYNSFNYDLVENSLKIKNNLIIPFMDQIID